MALMKSKLLQLLLRVLWVPLLFSVGSMTTTIRSTTKPAKSPPRAKDLATFIIRNIMLKTDNDPKTDESLTQEALKELFQIPFSEKSPDTELDFKEIFDELLLHHHQSPTKDDYQIYKKMYTNIITSSDSQEGSSPKHLQLTDSTPYYSDSIWGFLKGDDFSSILEDNFWNAVSKSTQQELAEYISTQTIQASQDVENINGLDVLMKDGKAFMYGGTRESNTEENCYILQLKEVDATSHTKMKGLIKKLNGEIRWTQEENDSGLIGYMTCFPEGQLPLTILKALKPILVVERDQKIQSMVRPMQLLSKRHRNTLPAQPYNIQEQAPWHLTQLSNTTNSAIQLDDSVGFAYNNTGEGVTVYIIDSGISPDHQEFDGGRATLGWSAFPAGFPTDCVGHGTQVGSVIAGKTVGVAKRAKIVVAQVLGCNGEGQNSGVLEGLNWVIKNAKRPSIINMSIGGPKSPSIDAAVKKAIDNGIAVVVAAGNNNSDACLSSPSGIEEAMVVGASTREGERAHFSNWGKCVDIFAPGRYVISASIAGRGSINKNNPQAGYGLASGTSLASPLVAGIMALMLQEDPSLSPHQLNQMIISNGRKGYIKGANVNKSAKYVALKTGSPNLMAQTPLIKNGDGVVIESFLQPSQLPFVPWGISNNGTTNSPPPKSDGSDEEEWGFGDYAVVGIIIALIIILLIIAIIGTKRLVNWRKNRIERQRIEREILESGGQIIENPLHHAVINDVLNAECTGCDDGSDGDKKN